MNANSHLIIFNRGAAVTSGGWIHIVPKGELPNREAGIVQVLDDESLDSILRNISADQQRLGEKWPGIYAGREHFIYNDDQDSAALGWFKDFERRADGLWAREDGLTDIGREVIKNGHYKFTSFVADRRHTQKLEGASGDSAARYRILKLDTIGFTNNANGRELLMPITNREVGSSRCDDRTPQRGVPTQTLATATNGALTNAATVNIQNHNPSIMTNIITKLGLGAEATEDVVVTEITRLQNRISELENEQVESLFLAHGVRDEKIRNRLKPVLAAMKDREERVAALTDFGFLLVEPREVRAARVLNRGDANVIQPNLAAPNDEELAAKAELEITDYKVRNRCTYAEARNRVRSQKPELFGLARQ